MENTIKFYNNRPVLVLRKDELVDFWQIHADIEISDIDLDYIAESYRGCDTCMVGYKGTCNCQDEVDSASDLLERIMENHKINDEALFWVKGKDLKDKPFEWMENKKLKDEISQKKKILDGLIDIVAENKTLIKTQEKQLKDNESEIIKSDRIVENRKALSESSIKEYEGLKDKIEQAKLDLKNVSIDNENEISRAEYIRLLKRDELLTALEVGGVDNWEWYGEATKNINNN